MTGFYKHGNEPSDTIKCGTSLIIWETDSYQARLCFVGLVDDMKPRASLSQSRKPALDNRPIMVRPVFVRNKSHFTVRVFVTYPHAQAPTQMTSVSDLRFNCYPPDLKADNPLHDMRVQTQNNAWVCGLDSSGSGQGPVSALVNTVMNLQVPQKAGKSTCWPTISFSRTLIHGVT
jgi:hypothetical protein